MSAIWSISKIEFLSNFEGQNKDILKVSYDVRKAIGKKPWSSVIAIDTEKFNVDITNLENVTQDQVVQWVKQVLLSFRDDFVDEIEGCLPSDNEPAVIQIKS